MIEEVRLIIQDECDSWNWHYHIIPVIKYAKLLACELDVDVELAELAALLHDIGRIRFGSENHELTGLNEAENILRNFGYSNQVINDIRHCVESHRCNGTIKPQTLLAKIIASADALSHLDIIPAMVQAGLKRYDNDVEKAVQWVYSKIERDYHEKLLCEPARILAVNKYSAFRLLFDAMRSYFYSHEKDYHV